MKHKLFEVIYNGGTFLLLLLIFYGKLKIKFCLQGRIFIVKLYVDLVGKEHSKIFNLLQMWLINCQHASCARVFHSPLGEWTLYFLINLGTTNGFVNPSSSLEYDIKAYIGGM
ncbi:hypothetical protein CR513_35449, partial [Mucuna pruriens]